MAARFFHTLSLTGNYTFLASQQRSDNVATDGKSLPGMEGHAKISLGRKSYLWRSWRVLRHWLQTVIWW